MPTLSADKPLTNPDDDKLGYAPFSKMLAKSIVEMSPPEGLVIAVFGEWGLGKSTCIEFIVHYLEHEPEEKSPIVVRFNPWWFSGSEDLVRNFFDQMQVTLGNSTHEAFKSLVKGIKALSEVVSKVPIAGTDLPKTIAAYIPDIGNKNVAQIKDFVSQKLKQSEKRILVIIDDIDRLDADEMKQLFTAIKAIADFPNVIYLLAFDKKIVTNSLGYRGFEYLEKIIQVSFELPIPSEEKVRELLFAELENILGEVPNKIGGLNFWRLQEGHSAIPRLLDTPRKVTRLANSLRVTYPVVRGEVDEADFVAIELIRILYPNMYDVIRRNKSRLVTGYSEKRDNKTIFTELTELVEGNEDLSQLLKGLFPNLDRASLFYTESDRQQLRLCSPDIFDTYFRLSIADDDVSNAETQALLNSDESTLAARLLDFANYSPTRITNLLRRILDLSSSKITDEGIWLVVEALLHIGDTFIDFNRSSKARDVNADIVLAILLRLLWRADSSKQLKLIETATLVGEADISAIRLIIHIGQTHGRFLDDSGYFSHQKMLSEVEMPELEKIALLKIKKTLKRDRFFANPYMPTILHTWVELEPDKANSWIKEALSDDQNLSDFTRQFTDVHAFDRITLQEAITMYIDIDSLKHSLERVIQENNIGEDDVTYAKLVLESLQKLTHLPPT